MSDGRVLRMWTLYHQPADFAQVPGARFVARLFEVRAGRAEAAQHILYCEDLETLRYDFERQGLYRMPRAPEDDPQVIETWL